MKASRPKAGSRACVQIATDSPFLEQLLADDCPNGVKIRPHPPYILPPPRSPAEKIDEFQLQVDLRKIAAPIFVDWMVHRALAVRGRHLVRLGRVAVPLRSPNAETAIARIICKSARRSRRRRRSRRK